MSARPGGQRVVMGGAPLGEPVFGKNVQAVAPPAERLGIVPAAARVGVADGVERLQLRMIAVYGEQTALPQIVAKVGQVEITRRVVRHIFPIDMSCPVQQYLSAQLSLPVSQYQSCRIAAVIVPPETVGRYRRQSRHLAQFLRQPKARRLCRQTHGKEGKKKSRQNKSPWP